MISAVGFCLALVLQAPPSQAEADAQEARHLQSIRQVTSGFARAGEGYFRPDGRAIIFQAVRNTPPAIFATPIPNQDDYQIFTADLHPDARPLMVSTGKGKCTCSYYHPDGKSILFASSHLDPALAEGAKPPTSAPKAPAYSRTERYRWEFDPFMDLFRADLDGSNLVRLTDTPGYDAEGSYSPDGKQIVFTSFRDGDAEIYLMDADGKNPRRITQAKGYDGGPFFSPDGKRIIYRSDRKDNDLLQIYINNTEGTAERALTNNEFVNWGPFFHPNNHHIIYATSRHGHQNYELYLMDIETGAEERITYREGFDGLPVFNADGRRLMWTSSGRTPDKKSQLFIADFHMTPDSAAGSPLTPSRGETR
jgi:TolB protein